jgi:hypothetical protein
MHGSNKLHRRNDTPTMGALRLIVTHDIAVNNIHVNEW